MKRLLLITTSLAILLNVKAQITLDYSNDSITFGGDFYCTEISNNEFKYVLMDYRTNSFSLYNMDMSLFMRVQNPFNDSIITRGFTVIYVTRTLFDCDSTNIEYVLTNPLDISQSFRILRTDGSVLFQVDSASVPYCFGCYGGAVDVRGIVNTAEGTKLFLQKKNDTWGSGVRIYSLCGILPSKIYDFTNPYEEEYVKIYPNPANSSLNFEITPPNNTDEFQILLFDSNARELDKPYKVVQNKFSIDVGNYSSGTYFFSLLSMSKNEVYATGKFILTK